MESLVLLTSTTNAHIGAFADYSTKICCKGTLTYPCVLKSAYWSIDGTNPITSASNNIVERQTAYLIVKGSGSECDGKSVSLAISPSVSAVLSNVAFSGDTATAEWTTEWQSAGLGDASYSFTAKLVSDTTKTATTTQTLTVTKQTDTTCSGINTCEGYTDKDQCNSDSPCDPDGSMLVQEGKDLPSGKIDCNSGSGYSCACSWDSSTSTCKFTSSVGSTCGDGVQETGEQCDLGSLNGVAGSGCSSTCTLEGTNGPCSIGLTLCSDGKCSLNCPITDTHFSTCDYNGVCDSGEGCTCSDCNIKQDTCDAGLTCNIAGTSCCDTVSDGVCTPGCESVDPDCVSKGVCGDGTINTGETCDGSNVGGKTCSSFGFTGGTLGCDSSCNIDTSTCTGGTGGTCGDGTINTGETCDGSNVGGKTCSSFGFTGGTLGCDSSCNIDTSTCTGGTGEGAVCGNDILEYGEQCDLGSLNGVAGSGCSSTCTFISNIPSTGGCEEGLTLCSDGTCSLNCFVTGKGDGDCSGGTSDSSACCKSGLVYDGIDLACCSSVTNGVCDSYCAYVDPDCNGQNVIHPFGVGSCSITQTIDKDCNTEPVGYKTISWHGTWTGTQTGTAYTQCTTGGKVTVPCPAQVQLPFFDYLELIGSVIVIGLIYIGLIFKKKILRKK